MNPSYVQRVEMQKFFAPPGVNPPMAISLIAKPISCDEIHAKEFLSNTVCSEMNDFFQQLREEYGDYQVIKTLHLENFVVLVYAVPRRKKTLPSLCGLVTEGL